MKKLLMLSAVGLPSMLLLNGCIGLSLGGGTKTVNESARVTVGQQLIDLQKAKEAGVINDAEYQAQRKKILDCK